MKNQSISRRNFLKRTSGVVITFSLAAAFREAVAQDATPTIAPELPEASATPTIQPGLVATPAHQTQQAVQTRNVDEDQVDSYLAIDTDGKVTLYSGKVELGTGVETALDQIVVEELNIPFDSITMIMGDTFLTPDQGTTAGSKTIQGAGPVLRQAAAEARLVLLTRASDKLGVPADQLVVKDGVVSAANDASKSATYGELATEPFNREVNGDAPTETPSEYTIVGQPVPRVDILGKLTGAPAYIQDITLDGMLHARVIRPRLRTLDGIGATVGSIDDSKARDMPGVVQIVRNGSFIAVVAEREEQAIAAAKAVTVTWADRVDLPDEETFTDQMHDMVPEDYVDEIVRNGDVDGAMDTATRTVKATYRFPYQAHASMGPSCGVADVGSDSATVYSGTQSVYGLRAALAPILGMDEDQVRIVYKEAAGCYGHNGADDASADAAVLSQAVGKPVRVQWMRQDEFAWEPKGYAMTMELEAGLDDAGNIVAWSNDVWTGTSSGRPSGHPAHLLVGQQVEPPAEPAEVRNSGGDRNAPTNYSLPNNRVTIHWIANSPLYTSALRSLGGIHNTTANEIFVDEVAAAAGVDPVELRLENMADPRGVDVINAAAGAAGWEARTEGPRASSTPTAGGLLTGRGFAYMQYENTFTYVATVADVEVDPSNGNVHVKRMTVGHDCGLVINPNGLKNQIQGATIQGTSRVLMEEVTWDDHAVTSLDWEGYHILTFPEVPQIDIVLVDRPEEPALGAGEPAICPVEAAVSNAIFDATGVRLREVPFTPDRVLAALQGNA